MADPRAWGFIPIPFVPPFPSGGTTAQISAYNSALTYSSEKVQSRKRMVIAGAIGGLVLLWMWRK